MSALSSAAVRESVMALRRQVAELHGELVRNELVAWTAGNVSARVPGEAMMVTKASGVPYDEITAETIVVCSLDGEVLEGSLIPSSETRSVAHVLREMDEVSGVVHTHSAYATAWAARGEAIPCVVTAMAEEFGGPIPVGPFATIGGSEIGEAIVTTLRGQRSPAVLMQNHGVFTIGSDARAAVKAAVMCEDVARTVHIARQLGDPLPIDPTAIDALYERYQSLYGQR